MKKEKLNDEELDKISGGMTLEQVRNYIFRVTPYENVRVRFKPNDWSDYYCEGYIIGFSNYLSMCPYVVIKVDGSTTSANIPYNKVEII